MRLGGAAVVSDCSFLSNFASTRGLAVDVVGSANISGSSFVGNQLSCGHGSYRSDTEEVKWNGLRVGRYTVRRWCFANAFSAFFSFFWVYRDT